MAKGINAMSAKEKAAFYECVASCIETLENGKEWRMDNIWNAETGEYERDENGNMIKRMPDEGTANWYAIHAADALIEVLNNL